MKAKHSQPLWGLGGSCGEDIFAFKRKIVKKNKKRMNAIILGHSSRKPPARLS